MKRVLLVLLAAVLLCAANGSLAAGQRKADGGNIAKKKRGAAKKISKRDAEKLRKTGEKQSLRHDRDMRRWEYEQNLDAQQKGMAEMQRHLQQRNR